MRWRMPTSTFANARSRPDIRLEAAGYLSRADTPYFENVKRRLEAAGLLSEFTYRGAVDRDGKLAFLQTLDVLSVPAPYDEPKGVFLLEAMASGVPVVQPRRGAFTEIVEKTGGGLLVLRTIRRRLASAVRVVAGPREGGRARRARIPGRPRALQRRAFRRSISRGVCPAGCRRQKLGIMN
jgi:Glycosyltransferase